MLEALYEHSRQITDVIVVDNGSTQSVVMPTAVGLWDFRVRYVRLSENSGSANGFRVGIEHAMHHTRCEFLWLLDDDNVPSVGALGKLLAAYRMMGGIPTVAVAGLRTSRPESVLATRGLVRLRIPTNSFLGFHVAHLPQKLLRRLYRSDRSPYEIGYEIPLVLAGYAPYGGLLLHRVLVEKIGLPNSEFFLYADDYEYTSRIGRMGGKLFVCSGAVIEDVDESWHRRKARLHPLFSKDSSDDKVYFSTRNRVYLEVTRHVTSSWMYGMNRFVYLAALIMHAFLVEREGRRVLQRYKLIRQAVSDGARHRLGRKMPL